MTTRTSSDDAALDPEVGSRGDDAIPMQRSNGWTKAEENPPEMPARMAARQRRARAYAQAPEMLAEYDDMSLDDLRQLRMRLTEQEGQISYWRRILQARLDLLVDGTTHHGVTVDGLNRVLSEQLGRPARKAMLNIQPPEGAPPMAGLEGLWDRVIDPTVTDQSRLIADLQEAEERLSESRRVLHERIDTVTAQLVGRYRIDPMLALSALPSRDHGHPRL